MMDWSQGYVDGYRSVAGVGPGAVPERTYEPNGKTAYQAGHDAGVADAMADQGG